MPLISVCAASIETPGFSLPITGSQKDSRASARFLSGASGFHASASVGHCIDAGMMPMTSWGRPLNEIVRPIASAAPPKRRCHNPYDITITSSSPGASFAAVKTRPSTWRDAHDLEEVGGHERAGQAFRLASAGEVERRAGERREMLVRLILIAPVAIVRIRGDVFFDRLPPVVEPDERDALGLGIGQRTQQHAVDDAEYGGVDADADRECQRRDEGESRRTQEHADGVPAVADDAEATDESHESSSIAAERRPPEKKHQVAAAYT